MADLIYIDRVNKKRQVEKVYGDFFLKHLYGDHFWTRWIAALALPIVAKIPALSQFYGYLQKTKRSRKKVKPFIKEFQIDDREFLDPVDSFKSFNDFFIRKLKPQSRPFSKQDNIAILPADARYLVYPNFDEVDGIFVKGKKFSLEKLLQDPQKAKQFAGAGVVIARLCPIDYHRFHFPCSCVPSEAALIKGYLYSVNPIALKKNIEIYSENKRMITSLQTKQFGEVLFIEVGATHVGTIHQTYEPGNLYMKGEEKGYFSFGGSCLILLFEQRKIIFDEDLVQTSKEGIETRGLLGQSLGRSYF